MLAGVLPVVVAAGLIARRPLVRIEPPSDRINLIMPNGTEISTDSRELWGNAVDDPDVLFYWTEQDSNLAFLPVNARLLGSLDSGRRGGLHVFHGSQTRGYLILYSLAYGKRVAKASVPNEMP